MPRLRTHHQHHLQELAESIQGYIREQMPEWKRHYEGVEEMKLAVMGCIVNGPGESKAANIGISLPGTGESPRCPVYIDGQKFMTLEGNYDQLSAAFQKLVDDYISTKYPKRETPLPAAGAQVSRARPPSASLHRSSVRFAQSSFACRCKIDTLATTENQNELLFADQAYKSAAACRRFAHSIFNKYKPAHRAATAWDSLPRRLSSDETRRATGSTQCFAKRRATSKARHPEAQFIGPKDLSAPSYPPH